VKSLTPFLLLLGCTFIASAQPSTTTTTDTLLKAQKDNIINANTIIKIENLGININSDLAELRPTVSADGNILFFITGKNNVEEKVICGCNFS